MTRTLAVLLLAMAASSASAGTYIGLGVGNGPATNSDLKFSEDGRSGRLLVGYRWGHFAVEGLGTGYSLFRGNSGNTYDGTTLGVAAKYSVPIGDKFEGFGRAGLQRTSLTASDKASASGARDYAGSGFLVGGGFEYRFDVGFAGGASVFIDYTIDHSSGSLAGRPESYGLTERIWTLGVTLSL